MDFVVIDVETANPDLASICQVGVASFRDGALVETWASLVNPEDYFSPLNVSIHHIGESHVEGAPTWSEVFPEAVSYTHLRSFPSRYPPRRSGSSPPSPESRATGTDSPDKAPAPAALLGL